MPWVFLKMTERTWNSFKKWYTFLKMISKLWQFSSFKYSSTVRPLLFLNILIYSLAISPKYFFHFFCFSKKLKFFCFMSLTIFRIVHFQTHSDVSITFQYFYNYFIKKVKGLFTPINEVVYVQVFLVDFSIWKLINFEKFWWSKGNNVKEKYPCTKLSSWNKKKRF